MYILIKQTVGKLEFDEVISMKIFVAILVAISMVLSLIGCSTSKESVGEIIADNSIIETEKAIVSMQSESGTPINTEESTITTQPSSPMFIDTEYYTLSAPNSWNDDCFYEIATGENYNYTLSFYDKASHDAINGGWLFSINLFAEFEDYSYYPDYAVLGSLEVYRIGSYNIVVTYPTDVPYSEETAEKYLEMCNDISEILDTISFKEECVFSDIPIPVEIIEETKPQYSERFIGKWIDLGIGSHAPSGATRWNIEYRSDGTGTFEFIFEADDIVTVSFSFSPFETYLGESIDGILIQIDGGADIRYMAKYTWSNELQKMLMTMYEVKDNGALNLDVYWVYAMD